MKTNLSKKEIRNQLESALILEIEKIEGSESSKRIKKVVKKLSKSIAGKVKIDMKKKFRKAAKRGKVEKKQLNGYLLENVEKIENGVAEN